MISLILDLLIFSYICILIAVRIGIRILDINSSCTAAIISIDLRISCCFTSSSVTFVCIPCRILNLTVCRAFSVDLSVHIRIRVLYFAACGTISISRIAVRILYASISRISVRILHASVNRSVFPACILIRVLYFAASRAVRTRTASASVTVSFTANRCSRCFCIQ